MSGEFFNLQPITPTPADELLIVRDRIGKRATIDALKTALSAGSNSVIASQTPPPAGGIWRQIDANGNPLELWRKFGDIWASDAINYISAYNVSLSTNALNQMPIPGHGAIFIDRFTARGLISEAFGSGESWAFNLNWINAARAEVPLWTLRLSTGAANASFLVTEPVGLVVDGLGLWLRAERQKSKPKLDFVSMSVAVRRIYAS